MKGLVQIMKKKLLILAGTMMLSLSVLLAACSMPGRTVDISSDDSKQEEESTKKSGKDDEEETTKKSKKDDKEETTTKKSGKDDDDDDDEKETTKKSKKDEEETTKKSSNNNVKTGWKKYSGTGYSLYIDDSKWTKMNASGTELGFAHLGTSANGFSENINTIVQDTSGYDLDLEGYKDLSLEQYDQLGYTLISIKEMTVNGQKGYYVITSTEENDIVCMCAQYFTMIDKDAYVFTFVADEDDFEDMEDEVIEIFETIEFE